MKPALCPYAPICLAGLGKRKGAALAFIEPMQPTLVSPRLTGRDGYTRSSSMAIARSYFDTVLACCRFFGHEVKLA
jgi:hypothetical protein